MPNERIKWYIIAILALGVLGLSALALSKGPAELTALAGVLTAGAALVANARARK